MTGNDLEKLNFIKEPSNYPKGLINLNLNLKFRVLNPNFQNFGENADLMELITNSKYILMQEGVMYAEMFKSPSEKTHRSSNLNLKTSTPTELVG